MSQVIFAVRYDQSFSRGVNCQLPPTVTIDVDPSTLTQEDRDLIASRLDSSGVVRSRSDAYGSLYTHGITADEPTVEGVLTAIRAEDEAARTYTVRKESDRLAAIEERRQRLREYLDLRSVQTWEVVAMVRDDWSTGECAEYEARNAPGDRSTSEPYERVYSISHSCPEDPDLTAQLKAHCQALDEETSRNKSAALTTAAARLAAAVQSRRDWVAAHGSARLVRLAAEGIACEATYQSERSKYERDEMLAALATDRPGWTMTSEWEIQRAVADVSMRTLALLDAGRRLDPDCKLAKHKPTGKYVCVSTYRGHVIMWPRD